MYKFDQSAALIIENSLQGIDDDGAAGEAEHHKFWRMLAAAVNASFVGMQMRRSI